MRRAVRGVLIAILLTSTVGLPAVTLAAGRAGAANGAAQEAGAGFSITTNPPLSPAFSPSIFDYVVRCTSGSTTSLTTTGTGRVKVGASTFDGPVSVNMALTAGQEVGVTESGATYYIRCLPSNFPDYSAVVSGTPQASGFLLTISNYSIVFDNEGVPVWWYNVPPTTSPQGLFDAKFLDPNTIAWWQSGGEYPEHRLNGTITHTVGGANAPLDLHDMQQLPNGNYLGIMTVPRNCPAVPSQCVDLSSWGLSSQSQITDDLIVELNRANKIVWQWSTADHIDVATANTNWRNQFPDVIHMNSIEYDGNGGIIFSARHLDSIYRIDMATGDITWKLGGSPTPQSLIVSGDQYVNGGGQLFSGQHDARLLTDGSMTVHDNGSRANRAPRALRFTIDLSTNTATEVEQVTDARATTSPYTGSVEKLPGGDWVADWGGGDFTTELSPSGVPQITITYPGTFSYRDASVLASLSALRQGMNAMVAPLTSVSLAPTTSVIIPSNGTALSGTAATLDATATNATSVQFLLFGGGYWGHVVGTATPTIYGWLYSWNTSTVANGSYVLLSEASNSGGNAFSSNVNITVQN
jgi:hypothetical protein